MRICSPQLGISPEATLGGEVYDREILTRIADLDAEVEILLPARLPHPEGPSLRMKHLPLGRGYRWPISNLIFVPYIGQLYRARPFDLLRVHSLRFTGQAALIARRLYHLPVPVVAHHHHLDLDRWTRHVDRAAARGCDAIVTGSRFGKQELTSTLGVPPERVHVVPYGVGSTYRALPRNDRLAERWGTAGKQVLLYVGTLKERKNLSVLLQAINLVCQEQTDVCLLLVGRGEAEQSLRQQVDDLGLTGVVRFAGFVPEADKVDWYNLADIFVLPSRLEGFGLAVTEAMACGRPVVASRAGALPEVVVDGETGVLCDPHSQADFAEAILRLLEDRALARAMGQAGQERVKRLFQWDESARRTLQIYEETRRNWGPHDEPG